MFLWPSSSFTINLTFKQSYDSVPIYMHTKIIVTKFIIKIEIYITPKGK